jgi:hypothetical protein
VHELALFALPALAGPLYAARAWLARRRARPVGALRIGERLPAWGPLPDVDGAFWGPKDARAARATVFVFMSNRCPGVKAYDGRLSRLAAEFGAAGVVFIGVNSVPEALYPGESRAEMKAAALERGLTFPYVKDAAQALQHLLGAKCTPQVFVVGTNDRLVYCGRIDDAFLEERVRRQDLREALKAIVNGRLVATAETHAIGCAIEEAPAAGMLLARTAPAGGRQQHGGRDGRVTSHRLGIRAD